MREREAGRGREGQEKRRGKRRWKEDYRHGGVEDISPKLLSNLALPSFPGVNAADIEQAL